MSFEKGDTVVLHDEHSEFDGEEGEVTQVMETMFGDPNYTIVFEEGQEAGIPEGQLDLVAEADDEEPEE
ncbi:DUF1918 domain-containing protein [Halolamina sp. CBA1230]|uniref:DUF1918 domain-containing protein n=1 Tax=Halolamina sp. CBA1230 TaxID=1853690 RepID=UPI0009A25670|nr:DUF1918 domain-containing protein [Halolamina sp. CBA1230]QKY19551.1 DUF1918 domain-containing protein [Halolamina sp. CBA1230]